MLVAARQTIHGLYAFTRFVLFGARQSQWQDTTVGCLLGIHAECDRKSCTCRCHNQAVLYDRDAEPSDLELAQVVAEATDIARQAAT